MWLQEKLLIWPACNNPELNGSTGCKPKPVNLEIFENPKQKKLKELSECELEPGWGAAEAAKLLSPFLPSTGDLSSLEGCELT